jgi:hypothetical protein
MMAIEVEVRVFFSNKIHALTTYMQPVRVIEKIFLFAALKGGFVFQIWIGVRFFCGF